MPAKIAEKSENACLVCPRRRSLLQVSWKEGSNEYSVTNDSFCRKHAKAYVAALLESYGKQDKE